MSAPASEYLLEMAEELETTPEEVLELWNAETPHFAGTGPHRYEEGICVYCGRPHDFVPA